MVHAVTGGGLALDLLVIDLEVFGQCGQGRGARDQRQKSRVEIAHVGLEDLRRVTLGIDRDKHRLQAFAVFAQQFFDLGQFGHGRRAGIGTLGIAKKDHHHFASEITHAAQLTVVVCQREAACVVGTSDINGGKVWLFVRTGRK